MAVLERDERWGLRRVRWRVVVGVRIFLWQDCAGEMGFAHMVLYRFAVCDCGAMLPLLVTHRPGLNRRGVGTLLVASFLGVPLQFLIQFYALSITTVSCFVDGGDDAGDSGGGAAIFAHERMDRVGWMALAGRRAGRR
jgi:hypothetical protein